MINVKVGSTPTVKVSVNQNGAIPVKTSTNIVAGGTGTSGMWRPSEEDGEITWKLSTDKTAPDPMYIREKLDPDGSLAYTDDGVLKLVMSDGTDSSSHPVSAKTLSEATCALSILEIEQLLNF